MGKFFIGKSNVWLIMKKQDLNVSVLREMFKIIFAAGLANKMAQQIKNKNNKKIFNKVVKG